MDNIYLLTHDGHRDSVNLQEYASNETELKKLLIKEAKELCETVFENSIIIDFDNEVIKYEYSDNDCYDFGTWKFFTIKKIS